MLDKKCISLSKTMAHALRHAPKDYGLVLDEGGWVDIDLFLEGLRKHSKHFENVTIHDLEKVIEVRIKGGLK